MRLAPRPKVFPFAPTDLDGSIEALRNPTALEQRLLEHGGLHPDVVVVNGHRDYWWSTPDGGSLDICIYDNAVYVDTHSHWRFVLELHQFLCTVDSELLILDNTKVVVHDARSYREFIDNSYSGRT